MISSFIATFASFFFIPALLGLFSTVSAAPADLLSGFAWSPNAGWLSFNCTDATPSCSGTNYGVTVGAPVSGVSTLSGYAWSSNLGWVTFNASDMNMTVAPESVTCVGAVFPNPPCSPTAILTVTAGPTAGQVSGWARACTVFASGCSGALKSNDERGGWYGWISLRGTSNYGVLANGSKWTGYAWGGGSVTGTVIPPVGGNAIPGWISFRGLTAEATPTVYGVNAQATTNAVGPQVISCGVNMQYANLNDTVTWTVVYDATKISSPTFLWTSLASNAFPNPPANSSVETIQYTSTGTKNAVVTVTASTGEIYVVDCTGDVVPGETDPGFPSVDVATTNLTQDSATNPTGAQEGVQIGNLTGQFDYSGPAISTPFFVRFEFDTDGNNTPDQWSNSISIPSLTLNQQNVVVNNGIWTPGAPSGTYRMRLCVDTTDVIAESSNLDNCANTSWGVNFTVIASVPAIDVSAVTCRPIPTITLKGKQVTWSTVGLPTGGNGSYTYDWVFNQDASPAAGTGSPSTPVSYPTFGTKTAKVLISSTGATTVEKICSVNLRVQIFEETPG